jgi:hypothetical protein
MNSNTPCQPLKSRFCYSYKPQGIIQECCEPVVCTTNQYLSTISSLPMVINNNTKTTERSLLLASQQQIYAELSSTSVMSTLQYTQNNNSMITSTIYGELLQLRQDRYQPYQPYQPERIPPSVIELEMNTANAGVPHSFFTIANCKGSQSVTTSNKMYN